jgi:hypothetical protein
MSLLRFGFMDAGLGGLPPPYSWIRELGVESLADPSRGDEWFVRLAECSSTLGGRVTGHLMDATTGPFIEVRGLTQGGRDSDTRLLVLAVDRSLALFAGGRDQPPDEDVIAHWLEAAHCATKRLGLEGEPQRWSALIGPPSPRIGGMETTLSEPFKVGPFVVRPEPHALNESWPSRPPSLGVRTVASTWLEGVEGESSGYNWQVAGKRAAYDLQRLCTLLSVAGAGTVVVRDAPAPLEWGRRSVPEGDPSETTKPSADYRRPRIWAPPDWLSDAWELIESKPWLAHALSAHHEGLRAQYEHASLALVAFISAVEAISNRLWIEHHCETCRGRLGIAARFRATLQTVLPDAEAEFLGQAYSPRSKTVHEGHLHGTEETAGVYAIGALSTDAALTFEWGVVYRMGRASESLLLRALQGQLPATKVELPDL